MNPRVWFLCVALTVLGGCSHAPPPAPVEVAESARTVSFTQDVRPILDSRCVVCHSCYNSPCQLKLSSFEGLERGGTDLPVYDSSRFRAQDPTRLFMDAKSAEEWRAKGFHSVGENTAGEGLNNSLLLQLLDAGMTRPELSGDFRPETDELSCSANDNELGEYLEDRPNGGMPFGFPALSQPEYETIAAWLQQGMPGPSPKEQRAMTTPSPAAAPEVAKWEQFLNQSDPKYAMTARYLYEHYFLAHLSFVDASPLEFYELVRSSTAPGKPIEIIATVRPYDRPDTETYYYRFRRIHSTIVHKTHMVVELDAARFERIQNLFIETPWLEEPHRMEEGTHDGADPFVIYAQIPPRVRYQFLLDHAEYIMRTFIRGPVCKGQVALNVIRDHFWVMFLDPDADATLNAPEFLVSQSKNLRLPTEGGSNMRVARLFSNRYRKRYVEYYRAKTALYESQGLEGFGLDAIWRGEDEDDAPVLTVYRHFDSASVHKGVLGDLPRTLWVIDYAQFERLYYGLVAGFDVFGNVSHQLNIRRYMDYLRMEGELNFLQFLPREQRLSTMRSWYLGDKAFKKVKHEEVFTGRDTQLQFETDDPKRELIERVVEGHILPETGIQFDTVNYARAEEPPTQMPSTFSSHDDILDGFRALTAPGTGFIRHMNGFGVNVIFLRVRDFEGSDRFVSIVINRWHDNVNELFHAQDRLDPARDTIDFIAGSVGSYPNYFFDVDAGELPDFFDMMQNFDGSEPYVEKARHYAINRADPRFWQTYDWFQQQLDQSAPLQTGKLDLNRYHATAHPPSK